MSLTQALKALTAKEAETLEEKAKHENELTQYVSFYENLNQSERQPDDRCDRCSKIFNLCNQIHSHQLEQGLHKEILCFEKTILDINEQEKPLLDSLIHKIGEIVKEVYPHSTVRSADSSCRSTAASRQASACHGLTSTFCWISEARTGSLSWTTTTCT